MGLIILPAIAVNMCVDHRLALCDHVCCSIPVLNAGHSIEYYAWEFGDGDLQVETSDLEVTHFYELSAPSQTYIARLTVFDDQGLDNTILINITLTQN